MNRGWWAGPAPEHWPAPLVETGVELVRSCSANHWRLRFTFPSPPPPSLLLASQPTIVGKFLVQSKQIFNHVILLEFDTSIAVLCHI